MSDLDTLTGRAFAERYGVTMDYASHGAQVEDGWEHNAYTLYLDNGASVVEIPWRQGYGIEGSPEIGPVLESLAMELSGADADFEEWAGEYGYDTDSRKAYATWEAVHEQSRKLYDWCRSEAMWDDLRSVQEA